MELKSKHTLDGRGSNGERQGSDSQEGLGEHGEATVQGLEGGRGAREDGRGEKARKSEWLSERRVVEERERRKRRALPPLADPLPFALAGESSRSIWTSCVEVSSGFPSWPIFDGLGKDRRAQSYPALSSEACEALDPAASAFGEVEAEGRKQDDKARETKKATKLSELHC